MTTTTDTDPDVVEQYRAHIRWQQENEMLLLGVIIGGTIVLVLSVAKEVVR